MPDTNTASTYITQPLVRFNTHTGITELKTVVAVAAKPRTAASGGLGLMVVKQRFGPNEYLLGCPGNGGQFLRRKVFVFEVGLQLRPWYMGGAH